MGSIQFTQTDGQLEVTVVQGPRWGLEYKLEGEIARGLSTIAPERVPQELRLLWKAMQIASPPAKLIAGQPLGQPATSPTTDALFGVGRRSGGTATCHPTNLVLGGFRAWVWETRWSEGGGDGWIGPLADHRAYTSGAWIREDRALEWAAQMGATYPLAALLMSADCLEVPGSLDVSAGTELATWEGVEIESEWISFDDHNDRGTESPLVYTRMKVRFGHWQGFVTRPEPQVWWVEPSRLTRDGYTPNRFGVRARKGACKQSFWASDADYEPEIGGIKSSHAERELAVRRPFVVADASGDWAAVFANEADWRCFADEYAIEARELGASQPYGGQIVVGLNRALAELAWAMGAGMVPAVALELTEDLFSGQSSTGGCRYIPGDEPGAGAKLFASGLMAKPDRFNGWVRADGHPVLYGWTVREPGDTAQEDHETVVFTNGRIARPRR